VTGRPYTTSTALLEALHEGGVRYLFANLGSDHPALIEAMAQASTGGSPAGVPELVVCPHETVAFSAAHAYALVTRQPQAVLVHVDSGTMNLGGVVANASRGRAPVLILAGAAPFTIEGELPGSRNEFIHWIQDVHDQRGILRNYTKYDNEIRTGHNVKQLVHRALQIARSEPAGPVYLTGAREVMEQALKPQAADPGRYTPVAPGALGPGVVAEIGHAVAAARRPLLITSYLGRHPAAVDELVRFCELLAVPVIEAATSCVNFPSDHSLHWGYEWTPGEQNRLLAEADTILVVDSDVPWIHTTSRPSAGADIYCIDIDPLKYQMPMWHIPARRFAVADSLVALRQLHDFVLANGLGDAAAVSSRRAAAAAVHDGQRAAWAAREHAHDAVITPAYLTACVRAALDGEDALILAEPVTNYKTVIEHLRPNRPGSLISSGGSALGFAGGGAVGAKLAAPGRTVVCLAGDGSYLFGVPSSAHWVARRYGAPALTVIYDNRGWRAPKESVLAIHPDGAAAMADLFNVSFEPEADLPGIAAAAGGAFGRTVTDPAELPQVLKQALAAVHSGRSAVVSAHLAAV
jgi:acetolactate synthase I/II/III large subunit